MALEESTAFCVEEGLEFSPPPIINASERLQRSESFKCCSVSVVQEPPTAFIYPASESGSDISEMSAAAAADMTEYSAALSVATVTALPAVFEEADNQQQQAKIVDGQLTTSTAATNFYPVVTATAVATATTSPSWTRC